MVEARTDRHNNPTAFTTDVAKTAHLVLGAEYTEGDQFNIGSKAYHTARLIGDPLTLTIKVIDKIGFYTQGGVQRWSYIGIPPFIWTNLTVAEKKTVIHYMYHHEGGTLLENLFG